VYDLFSSYSELPLLSSTYISLRNYTSSTISTT
jgi:hypothetical protein